MPSTATCACGCGQQTRNASKTSRARGWIKGQPLRYLHGHAASKMAKQARPKADQRFFSYVQVGSADECWIWTGKLTVRGYGQFWFKGRSVRAHRWSYLHHHGPIPEGLVVRHRCDNPSCVNPNHLLVGTHLDNMADAVERSRHRRGKENGSKLSDRQVQEVRRRAADGEKQKDLAPAFGVSTSLIQQIVARRAWAWLP